VLWSDGGGKVRAARKPINGRNDVARLILGLMKKWGGQLTATPAEVNGQAGFLLEDSTQRIGVLVLDIAGRLIQGVRIVVNPEKLTGIAPREPAS
jgi:RNA polymerase sigma-70 factor (ECF subfamily)